MEKKLLRLVFAALLCCGGLSRADIVQLDLFSLHASNI
jgi:hypothetical protein